MKKNNLTTEDTENTETWEVNVSGKGIDIYRKDSNHLNHPFNEIGVFKVSGVNINGKLHCIRINFTAEAAENAKKKTKEN